MHAVGHLSPLVIKQQISGKLTLCVMLIASSPANGQHHSNTVAVAVESKERKMIDTTGRPAGSAVVSAAAEKMPLWAMPRTKCVTFAFGSKTNPCQLNGVTWSSILIKTG